MGAARNRYGNNRCTSFSSVTELTCLAAAAERTTAWSFTPIPTEFISESNSETETLRSLGKLRQLLASFEATGDSTSVRERRRSQSAQVRPRILTRSLEPLSSGS